jgi:hypothetical protein
MFWWRNAVKHHGNEKHYCGADCCEDDAFYDLLELVLAKESLTHSRHEHVDFDEERAQKAADNPKQNENKDGEDIVLVLSEGGELDETAVCDVVVLAGFNGLNKRKREVGSSSGQESLPGHLKGPEGVGLGYFVREENPSNWSAEGHSHAHACARSDDVSLVPVVAEVLSELQRQIYHGHAH